MTLGEVQDTDPFIRGLHPCTVKGSRFCKPCNVLHVKYGSIYVFSMV